MMKELDLGEVHRLLEPGPVVLLTTAEKGRSNVMALSWHMMVDFLPPLVGCVVRGGDHSFAALRATGECVLAIPPAELAPTVLKVGRCSGRDVDKFLSFGLTAIRGDRVAPPLISECFANLECRVVDDSLVNRHNLFILEVLKAWIDPVPPLPRTLHHTGHGRFVVDGETLALPEAGR